MQKPLRNRRKLIEAVAYLRTSSATNIGEGKDSEARQRRAIGGFAGRNGYALVCEFNDPAVSGADPIETRTGFAALLAKIAGNGARTIVVETASRFARDLMVQEVGFAKLRELGITLIAADSPTAFLDDGPTSKLIRQILGAVSEFDKAMIVAKLKGARDRQRAKTGKCEGRKTWREICEAPGSPYAATSDRPSLIDAAKALRGSKRNRAPLRTVAAKLAALGFANTKGRPFSPASVKSMLLA
jgi:DNA invertase Pin-like site-specific DNA recombinase